jgi:hypothetical protein
VLESDCRGMMGADRGKLAIWTGKGDHRDRARQLLEQGKMNCVLFAPQPKQRGGRLDELPHGKLPAVAADNGALFKPTLEGARRTRCRLQPEIGSRLEEGADG